MLIATTGGLLSTASNNTLLFTLTSSAFASIGAPLTTDSDSSSSTSYGGSVLAVSSGVSLSSIASNIIYASAIFSDSLLFPIIV